MALNLGPLNVLLRLQGASQFQKSARRASESIRQVDSATRDVNGRLRDANGRFISAGKSASSMARGASQLEQNTRRASDSIRQLGSETGGALGKIKGLAAGYASLAGAAKAFDLSREAAKAADAIAIFRHAGGDLDGFRESVRGTVSDFELVKKANLARIMGIPAEAMGTLAQAAMAASSATGESVDFMLDSIVRGVARGSPLILDNLGIIISIGEANEEYAKKLGKTAEALTKAESAQAVLSATLKAVKPQIEAANAAGANSAEIYQRMSAQVDNLSLQFGQALLPAMANLLPVLVDVAKWMGYLITGTTPEMQAEEAVSSMADEVQNLTTQLDKARRQLKGLEEAKLSGTVAEHIQTVLPGLRAYSEEAAFGALEMQIADFEEKIAALQKRARGGGRRAALTPTPTRTAAAQGPSAFDAARQEYRAMLAPTDLESAAPGLLDALASIGYEGAIAVKNQVATTFTPRVVGDVISPLIESTTAVVEAQAEQTEAAAAFADKMNKKIVPGIVGAIKAVESGTIGSQVGAELGGMAGAAIGNMLLPGVGGAAGGAIGSALGGIMGSAFDELIAALGVLTPVFDLLGDLIATMSPALIVLREMLAAVADMLFKALGPPLMGIFNALAKLMYPILIIFEALAPILGLFLNVAINLLLGFLVPVLDLVASLFQFLSEKVLIPVAKVFLMAYNSVVDFINGITYFVRNIEIAGQKPFESFGVILDTVSTNVRTYAEVVGEETDARAEATESLREFNEELTNVPLGVKRLRLLQYGATRGQTAFPNRFNAPAWGA